MPFLPPLLEPLDAAVGVYTGHQLTSDSSLQPQLRDVLSGEPQAEIEPPEGPAMSSLLSSQGAPFSLSSIQIGSSSRRPIDGIERQHSIPPLCTSTQGEDSSGGSTPKELADIASDNISSSPLTFWQNLQFLSDSWNQHGILPKKWRFDDIDGIEQHPFAVTASSDVKKASRGGNPLALKFFRPRYGPTGPEEPRMELLREACLWSLLDHRYILPFLGIFVRQSRLALVSQHQANGSLHEFLVKNPDADRIQLLWKVLSALKYLHSLPVPVMHGDIRAMNIVVDSQGEPLLMDFGCSSFVNERGHAMNSPSDQLRGTPRHLPPEKMLPGPYPITLQADIWSFAMLCIEVFTNERPFNHIVNDGAVVVEVLVRHAHPPRPQGPFAAQLADEIWEILERCWELDPSRRPSIDAIEALFGLHLST